MRSRSIAIVSEALLVSLLTAILVAVMLGYVVSNPPMRHEEGIIDVELCGTTLVVYNYGPSGVTVRAIYSPSGEPIGPSNLYVQPHGTAIIDLGSYYDNVTLVGEGFPVTIVTNSCTG